MKELQNKLQTKMDKTIEALKFEFSTIRAGRANPVSPPRAVKLQGNAYLGPGIGVSPGASPCMKLL